MHPLQSIVNYESPVLLNNNNNNNNINDNDNNNNNNSKLMIQGDDGDNDL